MIYTISPFGHWYGEPVFAIVIHSPGRDVHPRGPFLIRQLRQEVRKLRLAGFRRSV